MMSRRVQLIAGLLVTLAVLLFCAAGAAAQAPQISTTPGLFPAFNPSVTDYVVRCQPSNPVQVSVAAPAGVGVSVDNGPVQSGSFTRPVALSTGQSFRIAVTEAGQTATFYVRCLPSDFPPFTATRTGPTQAQWYAVTPNLYWPPAGISRQYGAFFDNNGVPVWWMKSAGTTSPGDLKLLANGNVAWLHQYPSTPMGGEERRLDGTLVRTFNAVGGSTDQHDIQLLPNGNYLIAADIFRYGVNLSACGGPTTGGGLIDIELQEITPSGAVVWRWRTSDHIPLAEVSTRWRYLCRGLADAYHWNSAEPNGDGYVLSFRHLDAVYRIDRASGAIDWKLGGTQRPESLTVIGDPLSAQGTFSGQHDARVLPDGTLTVFDNGTGFNRSPRAVRFAIDAAAGTATLRDTLRYSSTFVYSGCCGSARKLASGNWVIAWGATRYLTEQTATGARVFQLSFAVSPYWYVFSYRANPVLPGQLSAAALRAGMDAQFPRS